MTKRRSVLDSTLAGQIHPSLNAHVQLSTISDSSATKIWWLGECGHSWEASVGNRARGSGCPFCAGNRVLKGVNDLGTLEPDISKTWSKKNLPMTPSDVSRKSHKKVWWSPMCGHEFQMVISQRIRNGNTCKVCSGHERSVGYNDLATTHKELLKEWDLKKNFPLKPSDVQAGSQKIAWWLGTCGHSYQARVNSRTRKNGTGCPICTNQKVLSGVNDLATTHPKIAKQLAFKSGVSAEDLGAGSEKKVWWNCERGHEYLTSPALRTTRGTGCPVCANLVIVPGENDLQSLFPEIAAEWDSSKNKVLPSEVGAGSKKMAWFLCKNAHSYQTGIYSRTQGIGCSICARKKVLTGFNDLATEFPNIASLWDFEKNSLKPSEVISGSQKKFWFKCQLGHSYLTSVFNKTKERTSCPICSNHQLLVGFNDLQSQFPEIAAQWHPTKNLEKKPTELVWGSHARAWFICEEGHEWQSTIVGRQKSGCPSCAKYGFDQNKPSIVYVLSHSRLGATKVGITNAGTSRLQTFKLSGWRVEREFVFDNGSDALSVEKQIKDWWRKDLKLPIYLARQDMGRAGGETETVASSLMPPKKVITKIESLFSVNAP